MEDAKITAKITTIGFKPSEIRPRKMWTRLQEEFLEMHNDFVEISNEYIPELNSVWKSLNPETEEKEETLSAEEQEIKDLKDNIQNMAYTCYMRDAFDRFAFLVNQKHPDSYLSGFVFVDGNLPIFGARIKQHPELWMTFEINSK